MSLKKLFLSLAVLLVLAGSIATAFLFQRIAEEIVDDWGRRIVEIQVRYDSARLQKPLEREIALAFQMSESNLLRQWITAGDDPELTNAALAEMESFRRNFRDQNFFVALVDSGAYYFNDRSEQYRGDELRYHLDADKPEDAWFFQLIEEGRPFHLNVNPDTELGITQLWIDVLIIEGERIIGMVGTGLELDNVLREIVDLGQPGITTLFVDLNGAIQLYRDQSYIDFASVVKPEGQKNTLDLLLDTDADRAQVATLMNALRERSDEDGLVLSAFVGVDGKRKLAGIAFLPEIGWYEVTFLDLAEFMPVARFVPVGVVFLVTLVLAIALFYLVLQRLILVPLARLEHNMGVVQDGRIPSADLPTGHGEIRHLIAHFRQMAESIRRHTEDLESKVRARTEDLEAQARTDALTGLANRHGMQLTLDREATRAERTNSPYGLIWIDVDEFKDINDSYGHAAGDQVLKRIGSLLSREVRGYELAARWGGDEFLLFLAPEDADTLQAIAERIRATIEREATIDGLTVTVSLGATLARKGEPIESVLHRADEALYAAKQAGRNLSQTVL
jgi:diguanylate cyclase (GGDEF)-like protein